MKEELLRGLSEEQIAKVKACSSPEEVLRLAKEEGIELSDDQLEAVSGGACTKDPIHCPACGSTEYNKRARAFAHRVYGYYLTCKSCGHQWEVGV